jgi:hypothetical protein
VNQKRISVSHTVVVPSFVPPLVAVADALVGMVNIDLLLPLQGRADKGQEVEVGQDSTGRGILKI